MPKKPRAQRRRAVRDTAVHPLEAVPREAPHRVQPGAQVAPPAKAAQPVATQSRRMQASLDLSYVPSDLKRILIIAGTVIVLLVVLSVLLR